MISNKRAVIMFSRLPIVGEVKSRMSPHLTPPQAMELQRYFLMDLFEMLEPMKIDCDLFLFYTGSQDIALFSDIVPKRYVCLEQKGKDLGERMCRAFKRIFDQGYENVILVGSDIPHLTRETLENAFSQLKIYDMVLGPTVDGGYYLIGMNQLDNEVFNGQNWGNSSVFENTKRTIKRLGYSVGLTKAYLDLDDIEDIRQYMKNDQEKDNNKTRNYIREKLSHVL